MADHMDVFDPLIGEILNVPSGDKPYIEIFPLCNVSIALQSLYIVRTILSLRKQFYPHSDLRIGIIGCGHTGCLLLRTIADLSDVKPYRIMVSTRRPETLRSFQRDGVFICSNNQRVCIVFAFESSNSFIDH